MRELRCLAAAAMILVAMNAQARAEPPRARKERPGATREEGPRAKGAGARPARRAAPRAAVAGGEILIAVKVEGLEPKAPPANAAQRPVVVTVRVEAPPGARLVVASAGGPAEASGRKLHAPPGREPLKF